MHSFCQQLLHSRHKQVERPEAPGCAHRGCCRDVGHCSPPAASASGIRVVLVSSLPPRGMCLSDATELRLAAPLILNICANTSAVCAGRLKKKYGIFGDEREELYTTARDWVNALGQRDFLGGEQPNLADLSVFGVCRAVTGTDTFMDLMHNTDISLWYERMMGVVGGELQNSGSVRLGCRCVE